MVEDAIPSKAKHDAKSLLPVLADALTNPKYHIVGLCMLAVIATAVGIYR
jgi:hypothetical protein